MPPGPQKGLIIMVKQSKKLTSKRIYTKMVWDPLRKEGLAKYAPLVMEYAPKAPVVCSMASKNKIDNISVTFGQWTFHYDSWSNLRDGYENLILSIAGWVQSSDTRK